MQPWMSNGIIKSSLTKDRLYKISLYTDKKHPAYIYKIQKCICLTKRQANETAYREIFKEYETDINRSWNTINSLIGRLNGKKTILLKSERI